MQRIRIYLVRHGHVQYFDENLQPINPKYALLSETGVMQISSLADHLQVIEMDQIFSSTMPRSIQTAEILAQKQKKQDILSFDEIREIKSGRLKELDASRADILIKKAYQHQSYALDTFMQGEAWESFELRVMTWLEHMVVEQVQQGHQNILVSAHDAVNRVILNRAHGLKQQDLLVQEQNYAGLNILDYFLENQEIAETRIMLQNFTTHNILKIDEQRNALEDVYHIYMKTNGFKGENK